MKAVTLTTRPTNRKQHAEPAAKIEAARGASLHLRGADVRDATPLGGRQHTGRNAAGLATIVQAFAAGLILEKVHHRELLANDQEDSALCNAVSIG